jgi:hypothetical protein
MVDTNLSYESELGSKGKSNDHQHKFQDIWKDETYLLLLIGSMLHHNIHDFFET